MDRFGSLRRLAFCSILGASISISPLNDSKSIGQDQSNVILKNGLSLKGQLSQEVTLDSNSKKARGTVSAPITVVVDGLRLTFFHNQLQASSNPAEPLFTLRLKNAKQVTQEGSQIIGVNGQRGDEFNEFGRRYSSVRLIRGPEVELLQGITEVSPSYLKVETMRMENARKWDMRLSVRSLPADRLVAILLNDIDRNNQSEWLDVVSFFNQAKMYPQAIYVLEKAIEAIPEMEVHRNNITMFSQSIANQMFDEVLLRRNAGQYELANALLRGFNMDGLGLETQLKVQKRLQDNLGETERYRKIVDQLREQIKQLPDPLMQVAFGPVVEEISTHISSNTIDRMADYDRLKDDASMSIDQRVALGIGGWILGPGVAVESLSLTKSIVEVRGLVSKYLGSTSEIQRRESLQLIKKMESGVPRYIAPLVSKMLPPLPLPKSVEGDPTRFLIEVPVSQLGGEMTGYYLQLPPQYDPYRSYPCVVALHGSNTEESELNWWSGRYNQAFSMADGEASRHGYIVITPRWNAIGQVQYLATENEHARALACMRDAMRRTSVDSNRVFVAGHYSGASMAWDMALAHPDLWAGAVMIGVDAPNDFHEHYHPSAKYVPTYFVSGELDDAPRRRFGKIIDTYVQSSRHDFMYVEYQGRGRDLFIEELSRIMEWMDLPSHTRIPPPEKLFVRSARPGDNFYYFLEVNEFIPEKMNHPLKQFEPKRVADIKIDRNPIANSISIETLPSKKYTLWLEPGMIDFSKKVKITDKKSRTIEVTPSVDVLLEDVRTRADRQRPFWAKTEL